MNFDLNENSPIYLQIVETLQEAVLRGSLHSGDKLPSQRELALMAKVNPNTVQRAYVELERVGVTETRRGEGTFVKLEVKEIEKLRENMAHKTFSEFCAKMESIGFGSSQMAEWLIDKAREMKGDN